MRTSGAVSGTRSIQGPGRLKKRGYALLPLSARKQYSPSFSRDKKAFHGLIFCILISFMTFFLLYKVTLVSSASVN